MGTSRIRLAVVMIIMLLLLTACALGNSPAGAKSRDPGAGETPQASAEGEALNLPQVIPLTKEEIDRLPPDLKRIHERGKLVVATYYQNRVPYFYVSMDGRLEGTDIDMAYSIARQLGVGQVEFNRTAKSFNELIALIAADQADMAISKISITLNRAQSVLFSKPYLVLHQAILFNRVRFSELKTKTDDPLAVLRSRPIAVGVLDGTSYVEFAKEALPQATVRPYANLPVLMEAVQRGEVMAAFYDEFEFKRHIEEHPDVSIDLQLVVMQDRKDQLAVAMPPGSAHLQQWVNIFLDNRPPLDMKSMLQKSKHIELKE